MTILSPRTATAGLKVPAASQPLPRGAITGVSDTRCHGPNGSRGLPRAAKNVNNAGSANILARRERINCNAPVDTGIDKNKKRQGRPPAVLRSCVLPELLFVHSLLEFGSRAELRDFASRDLDRSAGLRVASVPRFSLRHREGPKTYQSHPISFSECRCNAVHGGINGSRGLRFTDFTRA